MLLCYKPPLYLQDSYFHNLVYTDEAKPAFVSITVNLPSSQPIPVPVNPPTGVQAVLGSHTAKVSWTVPHLLGGQGQLVNFLFKFINSYMSLNFSQFQELFHVIINFTKIVFFQ